MPALMPTRMTAIVPLMLFHGSTSYYVGVLQLWPSTHCSPVPASSPIYRSDGAMALRLRRRHCLSLRIPIDGYAWFVLLLPPFTQSWKRKSSMTILIKEMLDKEIPHKAVDTTPLQLLSPRFGGPLSLALLAPTDYVETGEVDLSGREMPHKPGCIYLSQDSRAAASQTCIAISSYFSNMKPLEPHVHLAYICVRLLRVGHVMLLHAHCDSARSKRCIISSDFSRMHVESEKKKVYPSIRAGSSGRRAWCGLAIRHAHC